MKKINKVKRIFNEMKKMRKLKIVFLSVLFLIMLIAAILMIIFTSNNAKNLKQRVTDPELARAITYGELTEEDEKTQSEYVRFSGYFARDLNGDGYAEKVKGTCKEVAGEDTLYMSLNVLGNGYLKDAKIEIEGKNVFFKTALVGDETIKGNYISENTKIINLKEVHAGTQKLIFGQVRSGDYRYNTTKKDAIGKDKNKYSETNKIKFTGTHVEDNGTETKIEKVIEFPVDWYSTTRAEIPYTYGGSEEKNKYQNYNTESIVDEENEEVNLEFKIVSQESNNKLLLAKSTIKGTIPELNGYKPIKVEITGENVEYTYNEKTGEFTAYRDAKITKNGNVEKEAYTSSWNTARYSEFKLKVTYPLEAYEQANGTVILNIPIKATFEGYNNPNEEFSNPYVSNVAEDVITVTYERGGGDVIGYDVQVGTWVPSPYYVYVVSKENAVKYYNNDDSKKNDTYEVRWHVSRGNSGTISNVQLKEQDNNYTDKFQKSDGTYEDMLKYSKNIGIYFTTPGAMFGENGWIKVYNDETDELIHEFTSKDWEKYTKENPYYYEEPVNHIRIETSNAEKVSSFTAVNIKELDNEKLTTDKTREEFDKLSKIYSYLSGYAKYSEDEEFQKLKNDVGIANYDEPLSMAQITNVTPTTLSTQETTNMKITIGTVNLGYNVELWENGVFLLKFPQEVLLAEINDVSINNGNVSILGYDIYEEDGNYYLKILTENENPENYTITIDVDVTPDPRKLSSTRDVELWAYNEKCNNYKDNLRKEDTYDINGDGSTKDIVDYTKKSVQFVGPTSLLTTETASDYNDEGDELKITVAPQIAVIDKTQKNKTAKISVQITNNYSGNISGVILVGKTPFKGNTSQILGKDLGSTFTAEMTGPIELPKNLQGIATVYYSENENVNNNINDESNNWKTEAEVTDFSKIRTYAIDFGDYQIQKGEEYICTYEIKVPQDINYNEVTYSSHAVYFYLETDEGKLQDQTETNKLGFMIARKYDLEISKVKKGTGTAVQGASFSVQAEGEENSRIVVSDSKGKINITDLYVGKVYTVKELKAPSDYVLNGEEVKFTTDVDENGDLQVEKISGSSDIKVSQATEKSNAKVSFTVVNEPKYTLKLAKEDQNGNKVQGVRFNLTGKGLPEAGRTVSTNSKGELTITGLYPDAEYTLTEIYAEGYVYSEAPIKFKTVWNGNNLEAQVIEGSFKNSPTVDNSQSKQPIMSASIVNTKLDEYSLTLGKFEKETPNPLEGALFTVKGKWLNQDFTTDENGTFKVGPLYVGIEYTIEEVVPPTGYALSDNIVRFVVNKDEEGKPYLQILEGEIKPSADFEIEEEIDTKIIVTKPDYALDKDGNSMEDKYAFGIVEGDRISQIGIAIDNEPLFSLTKVDGETQKPLPNVKFAITKVEDDGTEAQAVNSKGEVIGETVEIDGKTYQIITTDEDGRITEDLPEGYYKVVEVETLEGYQLPENEEDRTYFFGIGKTKPAVKEIVEVWSQTFEGNGEITYTDSVATDDGGYVVIGDIYKNVVIEAKDTVNNEDILLPSSTYKSGVIIKYNSEDKIEWARTILENINENMASIEITDEGEFVIAGNVGKTTIKADNTEKGEDIKINEGSTNQQAFIMLCNNQGRVKWIERINNGTLHSQYNGIKVLDNGYVCVGYTYAAITIPADKTTNNQEIIIDYTEDSTSNTGDMIAIKYDKEGKIEWATSIGGTTNDIAVDLEINEQEEIVIIGNTNSSNINIDESKIISNNEIKLELNGKSSSFITKINSDGKIIWIKKLIGLNNGSNTMHSIEKAEEGYLVVGEGSGYILTADETKDGTDKQEAFQGASGEIMKYTEDGLIDWIYSSGVGNLRNIVSLGNEKYATVGRVSWFVNLAGKTAEGYSPSFDSKGTYDAIIIRYNGDGKIEKINRLEDKEWGGQYSKVNIDKEGNIIVLGSISGVSNINVDGQNKKIIGVINAKYDKELNLINLTDRNKSTNEIYSAIATNNGGNISVGRFSGKLEISSEKTVTGENIELYSNGRYDCFSVKYNSEGLVENVTAVGGGYEDVFYGITKVSDGYIAVGRVNEQYTSKDVIIAGEYTQDGEDITIDNIGNPYGIIIKYNEEGKIVWGKSILSTLNNIKSTDDDGYVIIGENSRKNTIPAEMTKDGQEITLSTKGVVVLKFNSNNKIEWYSNIGDTTSLYLQNLDMNSNNEIFIVGYFNGTVNIDGRNTEDGNPITLTSNSQKAITIKYNDEGKVVWAISDLRSQNLTEESVLATEDSGYIKVWHGYANSIIIDGNKTVDGKEITLTGGWTTYLIKYNEENKVEYAKKPSISNQNGINLLISTKDGGYLGVGGIGQGDNSGILIIKYDKELDEEGITIQSYTINEGRYEFVTEIDSNEFLIIGNRLNNGQKSATINKVRINTISAEIPEQQKLTIENYKKEYKITTDVEGVGGTISGQGSTNDNPYETVEDGGDSTKDIIATPEPGYKVLEITVNGEKIEFIAEEDGSVILNKFVNMTSDKHVVVKFSNTVSTVIVHHYKDGTTEKLAKDELLTGEIETNYTTAPKTDITDYEVVMEKLPSNASGQYTEAEQEVIYYYKQIPVKLIVHHYIEGTEEIVPGSEDDQINEERKRNSEYTTNPATDIDAKYELVATPSNSEGTLTENETIVTYYYRVKDSAGVIVHHIDTDTKEKIADDVIIAGGKYGDEYITEESKEIPENYKYVNKSNNWKGTMIDALTDVTYEYKLEEANIVDQVIDKTGTDRIINKDDEVVYNIKYTGKIENYIGKAQVIIKDTLPYKIDVNKSILCGGEYDEETQTITWVELIDEINTYENMEDKIIEINKTIKLVYSNMDYEKEIVENKVNGKIKLLNPEKIGDEVTDVASTKTDFKINLVVNKEWEDNEDKYGKRPETIKLEIYKDNKVIKTVEFGEEEGWNTIIENLPKYDKNTDEEIVYSVKEKESNEKDLYYYETEISELSGETNEKEITITNRMKKIPGEVIVKYIDKNTGVEIEEAVKKEDAIGTNFDVTEDKKEIEGYTLVAEPAEKTGIYAEETQIKTYYYAKNTTVHVKYVDKVTNDEIASDENIIGYERKQYTTEKKIINNYTYVEDSKNTSGIMTRETIEVVYYYLQNTQVKVEHVDKNTNDVMETEIIKGLEGDTCETSSKNFEGYILVEEPEEKTVTMTKDEIVVRYYYAHISAGVLEKHIVESTGEVLYQELHEGKEGDEYSISERDFEGYDLIMSKYPVNADGYMGKDLIEVIYYYELKDVNIIKNEVTKEGTASIDKRTDKVSYNIVYEGVIDTYRGEVVVYLEDTLPYKIDVEESELDGGTYDEETNTIKWYENIGEVDTLETGENIPETIRVEKNIEVLYKDIDIYQNEMVNKIKGVMYLPADNRTVEDESEFETEIAVKGDLVVKYIDKNTNEEISSSVEKTGRVGTEYDVTGDKKEISGYTLIEEPVVKTGTYTEESQEKIYYYAKNTDVHVRYVDKISKEEIAEEEIIEGYEGQKYVTDRKEITGYTFVEDSGNTEGEMTRERTEVVYYYLYKTKVRVEHRDKYTDGLLGEEEQEGLEGEVYESSAKDFEGYVLVEEPENRTVTMTKEEIVLVYYYSYISGGVIEKHIDEITGEVLDEEVYEGQEGEPYTTSEKDFKGYDLVEEKYPSNATGTMMRDVIEVKYYYIKKATVRVEYIDKVNDNKLTEDVIIEGHENDPYRTEEKEFEGYDLVEIPENATGEMKVTVNEDGTYETEIVVKYYYKYISEGVVEKHIDDVTGEVITEEKHTGYEGDKYETKEKEIAGYELVKEKYPENATGTMTRDLIEVDYYYKKKVTIRVEYKDKANDNKLLEDVIIEGSENDEYKTEQKEFEGYDFIEVVGESEGIMIPGEEIVVTYYYMRPAEVITRYLEEGTEEEIAPEEVTRGHEGDEYVTAAKQIEYYKISKLPDNATGTMKDTIYVTYYYKKKTVDFSLDKTIDSMKVEGKAQRITNEDLVKAEVYRKSINSTDIKVVFNIKVTNEGEIAGKVDILEKIPEYLSMSEKDNPGWTVEGEEARYETETIEAGKSKTYKVVMTWKKGDGHFGMQKNIAKIEKVITPSGFDEENLQNNSDESEVMITISTGVEKVSGIVLIALIYMLAIIYMNRKLTFAKVEVEDDKKEK